MLPPFMSKVPFMMYTPPPQPLPSVPAVLPVMLPLSMVKVPLLINTPPPFSGTVLLEMVPPFRVTLPPSRTWTPPQEAPSVVTVFPLIAAPLPMVALELLPVTFRPVPVLPEISPPVMVNWPPLDTFTTPPQWLALLSVIVPPSISKVPPFTVTASPSIQDD